VKRYGKLTAKHSACRTIVLGGFSDTMTSPLLNASARKEERVFILMGSCMLFSFAHQTPLTDYPFTPYPHLPKPFEPIYSSNRTHKPLFPPKGRRPKKEKNRKSRMPFKSLETYSHNRKHPPSNKRCKNSKRRKKSDVIKKASPSPFPQIPIPLSFPPIFIQKDNFRHLHNITLNSEREVKKRKYTKSDEELAFSLNNLSSLNIISVNVQGLTTQAAKDELYIVLQEHAKEGRPADILCIQETWISGQDLTKYFKFNPIGDKYYVKVDQNSSIARRGKETIYRKDIHHLIIEQTKDDSLPGTVTMLKFRTIQIPSWTYGEYYILK
jgi:hypothetical protein